MDHDVCLNGKMHSQDQRRFFRNPHVKGWKKVLAVLVMLLVSFPYLVVSLVSPAFISLSSIVNLLVLWAVFFWSRNLSPAVSFAVAVLCGIAFVFPVWFFLVVDIDRAFFYGSILRKMTQNPSDLLAPIAYFVGLMLLMHYLMQSPKQAGALRNT